MLSAVTLETIPSIHRLKGSSLYMIKWTFYVPNETVGKSVPITFLGKKNRTCRHECIAAECSFKRSSRVGPSSAKDSSHGSIS